MAESALAGVNVIEIGGSLGAAYCTKLLADLGARVLMIEPSAGHPLRHRGAARDASAHAAFFASLSLNKESVVAPAEAAIRQLVAAADIVVTDGSMPAFEAVLAAGLAPHAIRVDISAFGGSGRYSDWKSTEFTTWAMGGYMYFMGEATGEPLTIPGGQTEFHAGMQAALAALAALYEQRRTGLGQEVEVSGLESALSAHSWLSVAWSHSGTVLGRSTHDFVKCRDGWVCFMRPVLYPSLFLLIERPDLADDPRWSDRVGWAAHNAEIYEIVSDWCAGQAKHEVVRGAQELRIACLPLNDAKDLAESPQLAARHWWLTMEDPDSGAISLPGFPYKLSVTPAQLRAPAPRLGEHGALPVRAENRLQVRWGKEGTGGDTDRPLAGLRVLELTSNWAGPICGRHLGDLGAEVIKVEAPSRPATRGLQAPRLDPQRQDWNRSGYFNQMNRNKRDVVLDLASAPGKAAFIELARRSDILIENNSARVMPNLGLGYDVLSAVNPALIMVSISGMGATGPERDYVAYGSTIEASSGLASVVGYDDSQPYRTGFYYADPIAGGHAAVAILAALEYRRRTGIGQFIDISLNESCAAFFAESLTEYQVTGNVPHRIGNRSPEFAPQGAYRCAGLDNWLAVTVCDIDEWRGLTAVIGRSDLGDDASLATVTGRRLRHDEIDEAITAWSRTREHYEAAWELQRAGVPAAPVLANWELLSDPHLFERRFYVPIEHPVVGVYPFPSWPWRFSRTPPQITRHAPLFGEHNREILKELGHSDDDIANLYAMGITADEPVR